MTPVEEKGKFSPQMGKDKFMYQSRKCRVSEMVHFRVCSLWIRQRGGVRFLFLKIFINFINFFCIVPVVLHRLCVAGKCFYYFLSLSDIFIHVV